MMKYDKTICPFCWGKLNSTEDKEGNITYTCTGCTRVFNSDDFEHELLRQRISSICSAFEATEEHPLSCIVDGQMELHIEGIDEAAQGLSEKEKPQVSEIFEEGDIVWIRLADTVDENFNPDNTPIELDSILTDSIREILFWLEEVYHCETYGRMDAEGRLIDK